jgi:opacity protein-like surface antigen
MGGKMRKKIIYGQVLAIIVLINSALAQVTPSENAYTTDATRRGTAAGAMLEIGVGSRAEALGGAFSAIADDPSALYWNPSGITQINSFSVQFTHTQWLVDTKFNALDLVVPIKSANSALGFHLALLDYGSNPVRTVFRPEGTGETYTAADYVAGLYWATNITSRISVALGLKYFHEQIWHVAGGAFAGDLSILFKTPLAGLNLAGVISNLSSEFALSGRDLTRVMDIDGRKDQEYNNDNVPVQLATEDYSLPLLFRFGMAYLLAINPSTSIQFGGNLNHPSNDVETVDLGIEGRILNSVYLRAGYHSIFADYAADGLTLGGGLKYKVLGAMTFTFDYAWSDWTILSSVHRFTIGISPAY